jgi:hypothetical protein
MGGQDSDEDPSAAFSGFNTRGGSGGMPNFGNFRTSNMGGSNPFANFTQFKQSNAQNTKK